MMFKVLADLDFGSLSFREVVPPRYVITPINSSIIDTWLLFYPEAKSVA